MQTKESRYFSANGVRAYEQNSSLRDILNVLFRRKKLAFLFFGGVVLAVTIFTYLTPEVFQSNAKLLIRVGRENLSVDPSVNGPTVTLHQSRENEVNSELAIITSRVVAERVVDKITPKAFLAGGMNNQNLASDNNFFTGLIADLKHTWQVSINTLFRLDSSSEPIRETAINKMMANLKVEVEQKSNVIDISYQAPSPQFGQQVLKDFLNFYQELHIKVHSAQASPQFFNDQAKRLFLELKQKENKLEEFRATHNVASISTQKDTLFSQISKIQGDIDEINSQISATKAQNATLEKGLQGRSKIVVLGRVAGRKSGTLDAIKGRLFDFRVKEADLSARYPDNDRALIEVRQQIKLAEEALSNEKLSDEVTTGIDPTYQSMQIALDTGRAQLQALIARKAALIEGLKKPKADLIMLAKNEMTESGLKRDVDLLESEYLQYRQNMQRTDVSKALDSGKVSNLSIIQSPTMPLDAIRPNKLLNLGLGVLLGLFGGICLAFFVEYLDDSLKTKEDVEQRLGLPVLVSVPCKESGLCI